jgi:hypothetical protein
MHALAQLMGNYYLAPCAGGVIESSGIRYAIVDGINVRDSRLHNYSPRWNAVPSQDSLVTRHGPGLLGGFVIVSS